MSKKKIRDDVSLFAIKPLTKKYGINLRRCEDSSWIAYTTSVYVKHLSPTLAVCQLVVVLDSKGKA